MLAGAIEAGEECFVAKKKVSKYHFKENNQFFENLNEQ